MDNAAHMLQAGREAHARRDWLTARACLAAARASGALTADDLNALGDANWWLGLLEESLEVSAEAYRLFVAESQTRKAVVAALGLAYTYALRGEEATASGWMSRAGRLLESEPECPEHGYVLYMDFEGALAECSLDDAMGVARRLGEMGRRFNDATLVALSVMAEGRVLIKQGHVRDGMARLDEAMLAALSDELDPSWAGNIYCHLMLACHELADLRRAGEWTAATARWCESMPGAGPFMGICRVHRAQVSTLRGDWDQAERDVLHVCRELRTFHPGIVAEAYYQLGEILRYRGDLAGAEEAFHKAHGGGRDPQPGLALLRLAQGRPDVAGASIKAALAAQPRDRLARARLRSAQVEIALASGDIESAREAASEVASAAATYGSSGLEAAAYTARGMLLLADGDAASAVPLLREAFRCWHEIDVPYEVARVRRLLATAFDALGDADSAALERKSAEATLKRLGVTPRQRPARSLPAGLTRREAEVLQLVAGGMSNAEIAGTLVLSPRTVERHLASIYQKLGFEGRSARAAAVNFAHREGLVAP